MNSSIKPVEDLIEESGCTKVELLAMEIASMKRMVDALVDPNNTEIICVEVASLVERPIDEQLSILTQKLLLLSFGLFIKGYSGNPVKSVLKNFIYDGILIWPVIVHKKLAVLIGKATATIENDKAVIKLCAGDTPINTTTQAICFMGISPKNPFFMFKEDQLV